MTHALLYHDLARRDDADAVGFPGPLAARYKLEPDRFEEHLDAIAAATGDVGLIRPGAEAPPTALTFDDGGSSALLAATLLEKRGWRAHFFVTTGRIGTPGFLAPDEIEDLAARGHDVGSHSHSHPTLMGRLPREAIDREWRESCEALGEILGVIPASASVPGGFISRDVIHGAQAAGYRLLMTSEPISSVSSVQALSVHGRYSIWSTTPPARAAAYARGSRAARMRLWGEWKAKGVSKRLGPRAYEALRRVRARRS